MSGASVWSWLDKDTGVLAIAAVGVALAVSLGTAVKLWFEVRKLRAERRKIDAETRAAERQERQSEREKVQASVRNILQSVSATVDELFATFYLFAYPPDSLDAAKLAEAIRVARRFRHEQRYRGEIEGLIAELAVLAQGDDDEALAQLRLKAIGLLAKISDKKAHVAGIEAHGLSHEAAKGIAGWLSEIRELQVGIASLAGEISGRLSLALDTGARIERAA